MGSNYLDARQNIEMRVRLYTELISSREQAESALRKDMFTSIIGSFLEPKTDSLEPKILQLELLAHNFHESLNLKPLFMHLKRRIEREDIKDPAIKRDYIKRLRRVAREVMWKQLGILEGAGVLKQIDIDLREIPSDSEFEEGLEFEFDNLSLENIYRVFEIYVMAVDTQQLEIEVELSISTFAPPDSSVNASFSVGPFDFPMIDNTRLTNDERCALVISSFNYPYAELTLAYFPGSHAGLREKPYFQEMLNNLLPEKD
jgi:hypothetical protein